MTGMVNESATRHKKAGALKTISEAADLVDVPQHVLRFWETKFSQVKPLKRNGGRRFYRPEDVEILLQIKFLLYKKGYTIKGAKKAFEQLSSDDMRSIFSEIGKGNSTTDISNDNQQELALEEKVPHDADDVAAGDKAHLKTIAKELRLLSQKLRGY